MKGLEGEKMKITVKSCVNRYELYTEPDNRLIGQLRKKRCGGKKLEILDAEGNLAASVHQEEETLFITGRDGRTVSCRLLYKEDGSGHKISGSLVRPPMPERIQLNLPQGSLSVIQTPRRNFEVYLNDRKICEMTHMLGLAKEIHILSDEIQDTYCSILFALAFLMLHDDDIDII